MGTSGEPIEVKDGGIGEVFALAAAAAAAEPGADVAGVPAVVLSESSSESICESPSSST